METTSSDGNTKNLHSASSDGDNTSSSSAQFALGKKETKEAEDDGVQIIAKFGKERLVFSDLSPHTTIGQLKGMIQSRTGILPKRQKLVGLVAVQGGAKGVTDELPLSKLKIKGKTSKNNSVGCSIVHEFILMGTPEKDIFVDPSDRDDLPVIVDDFELDFNAGSEEWLNHVANQENLRSFTEKTQVHMMNPLREGKPLLVLDLDHTLLDFSSKSLARASTNETAEKMKRPYMDEFLTQCYHNFDMVIWSQTNWRYIELKLTELGMLANPGYKFAFILDKTSMFTVTSTRKNGSSVQHHVKPLQIIWSKFPQFNSTNTVHIDDLSRNFALNLGSGLQVTAFHRKKKQSTASVSGKDDIELWALGTYLKQLAEAKISFDRVDFEQWREVCKGSKPLVATDNGDDEVESMEVDGASKGNS